MSAEINSETRVADLLAAYPALEGVLIEQASCFAALKNPILRKTVGRVATLEKAAQMAGIPVHRLVSLLREAAGLPAVGPAAGPHPEPNAPSTQAPEWVDQTRVVARIDADALLAAGQVPLTHLHPILRQSAGGIVCVTSTFRPAPLVEALERAGNATWTEQTGASSFRLYVRPSSG